MAEPKRIRVGIDVRLRPWAPEVKYALRTLLVLAGHAHELGWVGSEKRVSGLDLYYGPPREHVDAACEIDWNGFGFDWKSVSASEPREVVPGAAGVPQLGFGAASAGPAAVQDGRLRVPNDWVFASYWLLVGAREGALPSDRFDNLQLEGAAVRRFGLLERAAVSRYARCLREHFERGGSAAARPAWAPAPGRAAFALTHDVDYPEILRSVEWLRWFARNGAKAPPAALRDPDAYWRFQDWVDLAREHAVRPAFYFMARRGSLLRFAMGEPDAFYEIERPRFRALFESLRADGCEIGLHASFRACEEPVRFATERKRLERLSAGDCPGLRHHYWRLAVRAPHDTLRDHARAGFLYDSSLAFEMQPGFRRGVCQPFRPFHPQERKALDLVELPPTWMDDHYDGRLAASGIAEPADHAAALLREVAECGGVAVLDYHVRGMNAEVFPRWGPWLARLLRERLPTGVRGAIPAQIAREYEVHERRILSASLDAASEEKR